MMDRNETSISKQWFIPLVIVISIVPLIVMMHGFDSGLDNHPWYGNIKESFDLYIYYKSLMLQTCGAIVAVIVVGLYIKSKPSFIFEKRSFSPIVALLVFSVFTIFSSVLAQVPKDASYGGIGRFEGCYVILSYVFFFYMVFGYARSKKMISFLLDALMIGAAILGLIGTLEALGVDFYSFDWVHSLLFFVEPNDANVSLKSSGFISSTLESPNYAGSYVPLVIPYCIYVLLRGDRLWRRVLAGVTFEFLCIYLYGSGSDTGLVALVAGVFVAVFFIFPELNKLSKIVIVVIGGVIIAIIAVVLLTGEFKKHFFVNKTVNAIENMKTDFNSVIITTSDNKRIRVTMDEDAGKSEGWSKKNRISDILSVSDEDTGENLNIAIENDVSERLAAEGYPGLSFSMDQTFVPKIISTTGEDSFLDVLHITDNSYDFQFGTFLGSNLCYLYQKNRYRVLLRDIDRVGFDGMYDFANGRGYIWACTIPLLKDTLLIGVGQDNYIYAFPNDDYVGKNYTGYNDIFIHKPHNLFLGIWVQQGLIALLAFLFLYVLFLIRAIRLCYGKNRIPASKGFSARGVVIMTAIGTTSYLVAGLANDSCVGVTPIYWVMLGVGYAAEAVARRKDIPDATEDSSLELVREDELETISGDALEDELDEMD